MDIFSHSNLIISDKDICQLVVKWIGRKNRSFNIFTDMLKSIGIVTPVTLCNFNKEKKCCDCITADGKTLSLTFNFGSYYYSPYLIVTEGELITYYEYTGYYPYNNKNQKLSTVCVLIFKEIKSDVNDLYISYNPFFCEGILRLPGDYVVTVNIYLGESYDKKEVYILKHSQEIETYLLGLKFPCTAQDIYKNIMGLYGFNDVIINKISDITVSVTKIFYDHDNCSISSMLTMSTISIQYGRVTTYIIN